MQGNYRLEIPKNIREFLGIAEGDNVIISLEGNTIIIKKLEFTE